MSRRLRLITIHLPVKWLRFIDELVTQGEFPNRSEAIRYFIYLGLKEWLRTRGRLFPTREK